MRSYFNWFILLLLSASTQVFAANIQRSPFAGRSAPNGLAERRGTTTNAARMARGLGPIRPKELHSPTRVRRQAASPSPSQTGYIAVYQTGTSTLRGYINPAAATPSIVSSLSSAGLVAYPLTASTPVELVAVTTGSHMAIGSSSGIPSLLSAASANTARFLMTTASTPAGSTPQRESTSSARYLETTVWNVDPTTNQITASFVNYDGSNPETSFVQQGAYLFAAGNAAKFIAIAPSAIQVDLVFIPLTVT